jgi:Tol biopolymer transport system component
LTGLVNEQFPTATADGQTLYFAARGASGPPHLNVAHYVDGGYGNVASLTSTNGPGVDYFPYVRPDGKVLYFASDRSGTSEDLYYAKVNDAGSGAGVAVTELNTGAHEVAPVISPDDLTLYFSRDVAGSGYEIFVATRKVATDPFGAAAPLAVLNSPSHDLAGFVTADGCALYLASDRKGGYGGYDVYVSKRPK